MIISASRRSDIPAYYHQWFANRLRAGWCETANPFNPCQVSQIDLSAGAVDAFVFWSRDVSQFGYCMDMLDAMGYNYYFNFTYNNYPKSLEPNVLPVDHAEEQFGMLADRVGPERIVWRCDPIILSDATPAQWHADNFSRIAELLSGHTRQVITSIMTPYRKTLRRLAAVDNLIVQPDENAIRQIISDTSKIAAGNGMQLRICCPPFDLSEESAPPAKCIDDEILRKEFNTDIKYKKDKSQRPGCNCMQSRDIGAYDTCLRGCEYCYAVRSKNSAAKNFRRHDPQSPRLIPV